MHNDAEISRAKKAEIIRAGINDSLNTVHKSGYKDTGICILEFVASN